MDDKLSLFQHNATLFTDMEEEERSYELETWKAMNLARGLAVILGWLLVALRSSTDLLYKNLRSTSLTAIRLAKLIILNYLRQNLILLAGNWREEEGERRR